MFKTKICNKIFFNLPVILLDLDPLLLNTPEHNQTKNKIPKHLVKGFGFIIKQKTT